AALDAGRPTIGVIANGVDIVYPVSNTLLYDRGYMEGLVLSEHPPGEHAFPGAFPRRNRLVSGLARALVVVEAADGSGTMLTVTSALEQGRDVFAVPGPISSATSRGTNRLIRDGATPLLEIEQLLSLYGVASSPNSPTDTPPCTLSPTEATVFDALSEGGRHVDELALGTGLPIGTLLGTLLGLELGGLAEQLPGNFYRRGRR
ncbi:MAG: DNA-processing protein DprA, partial [Gemmatimonadales bacterium]